MLKTSKESLKALYKALLSLENEKDCESFLADICTMQEVESLAQRLQVAQMLDEGKSYLEVNKETGVSTATIGRVSRCLQYGTGGYKKVLAKLKD
ncbi:MAG: hypothetical protein IJY71_07905 [Clostridia bacterium]|nr:hypothetical protein [Clostridia bacterium]